MRPLAMNEFTTMQWSFEEDVRAYAAAGYQGIGAVRDKVEAHGLDRAVQLLKEHNLKVADLCIAGGFTQPTPEARAQKIEDARRGIEMAAGLEADALALMSGPPGALTPEASFALLRQALEQILPHAEQNGVRLALEPTHPMYRGVSACVMTLGEALDMCEAIDSPFLGVWLDTYHIWWDNTILQQIHRARGRIFGVHVNDWKQETRSLLDWGVPGEGIIPLRRLLDAIETAGWDGVYSVEIFSENRQPEEYPDVLRRCRAGFDAIWASKRRSK
jgi:sugar phosphate isomerase/epimerase